MRCGEKGYQVLYELNGERKTVTVSARTPAEARKVFRRYREPDATIVSVTETKRKVDSPS